MKTIDIFSLKQLIDLGKLGKDDWQVVFTNANGDSYSFSAKITCPIYDEPIYVQPKTGEANVTSEMGWGVLDG